MREAMALLRAELGAEAVILDTRRVAGGIELTAAREGGRGEAAAPLGQDEPLLILPSTFGGAKRLGVGQADNRLTRVQDHGRCDHRPDQWPPPGFVHASNQTLRIQGQPSGAEALRVSFGRLGRWHRWQARGCRATGCGAWP